METTVIRSVLCVTNAPTAYDFGPQTVETVREIDRSPGKTYRLVKITGDESQRQGQLARYHSGLYLGVQWNQADKYLFPDEIDRLFGGIQM